MWNVKSYGQCLYINLDATFRFGEACGVLDIQRSLVPDPGGVDVKAGLGHLQPGCVVEFSVVGGS